MGQPPILYRESGVWVGRLRNEEKETKNAPKANIKPHKAIKRRNQAKQRSEIKTRRVFVCNEHHTNKWNINRYKAVCKQFFVLCLMQEKEERERRKSGKWCNRPPLFLKKYQPRTLICETLFSSLSLLFSCVLRM